MPDPFAEIPAGAISPYLTSFNTVNSANAILRQMRNQGLNSGGGPIEWPPLPPATRVWIRNDTGARLNCYSVVKLGDPVTGIADADNSAHEFCRDPIFKATTPDATTNNFAILTDTAEAAGSPSQPQALCRAVTLGVVPVDVNVTDTAHGFATPTASDATKLTSAAIGPAIILYKPTGTGVKRCVVEVTSRGLAGLCNCVTFGSDYTLAGNTSTQDSGFDVSITTPGLYLLTYRVRATFQHTATGANLEGNLDIRNSLGTPIHIGSTIIPTTLAQITATGVLFDNTTTFVGFVSGDDHTPYTCKLYVTQSVVATSAKIKGNTDASGGTVVTYNRL